ncbi:MAG: ElyC/SanA/YdcF family protein [Bacteroidia bacterium]|nr:ElyC/SanA/YdcF family protein [Bacteroidia bacterium]
MEKKPKKRSLKKTALVLLALSMGIVTVFICNYIVIRSTTGKLFVSAGDTPKYKVGLLLGTSKYLKNGKINLYYRYRIEAAQKLYEEGKIEYILVSGDNGTVQYNEPRAFHKDLVAAGIPEDRIILDFAGFRTLDSIVRAKKVFGQNELIIISQAFHNQRAVYIAQRKGIKAVGFNAQDAYHRHGLSVPFRELLARTMMMADLYLLNRQPKFLGEPIEIG